MAFANWRQDTLDNSELKEKIISMLFKSNSILFRKSMANNLTPNDCIVVLKLFKLLGKELITHIQKKKLENTMSLLIFELFSKVLESSHSTQIHVRGKYSKLIRNCEKYNQFGLLLSLTQNMQSGFIFEDLLLNNFCTELLLNGMFLHVMGNRFSLETHRRIKSMFSYLRYEHIDVFEISRTSQFLGQSPFSLKLQLICLLSINEFDNEVSSNFFGWDQVIKLETEATLHSHLHLLTNNFSQKNKSVEFEGSIKLGNLNSILGDDNEQVEDFFERMVSDKGVFSRNFTVKNFSRKLLAFLTVNESKSVFHRLNWLINVENLKKLTRMNKIVKYIQMDDVDAEIQEMSQPTWLSDHLSFLLGSFCSEPKFCDWVRDYGYNEAEDVYSDLQKKGFPAHDFSEERTGVFELCSELAQIEENEDEKMAELELNSQKQLILSNFCFYTRTLAEFLHDLLSLCSSLSQEQEASIALHSIILLNFVD